MTEILRADDGPPEDALAVRRTVFVDEQGVAEEVEIDGRGDEAIHFVAYDGDRPVGAARLRAADADHPKADDAETGKVERVAVVADRRGEGVGERLMASLEEAAADCDLDSAVLHAQVRVQGFYEGLGYEQTSGVFEEAGIDHVEMRKDL